MPSVPDLIERCPIERPAQVGAANLRADVGMKLGDRNLGDRILGDRILGDRNGVEGCTCHRVSPDLQQTSV
jgi:hypothetical protein